MAFKGMEPAPNPQRRGGSIVLRDNHRIRNDTHLNRTGDLINAVCILTTLDNVPKFTNQFYQKVTTQT